MSFAFPRLGAKQQRGSKPRCHLLTCGNPVVVADRLTSLIDPWGSVRPTDTWMPSGFDNCSEAQLHSAKGLLPEERKRKVLRDWWLAVADKETMTPNIDLASTCQVRGKDGLLLIEAKAHDYELRKEEGGKRLKEDSSDGSIRNHEQIGTAIGAANASLRTETQLPWSLSRDSRYQMSNRFAWAWKLTELGIPVILVYLGFIGCEEMQKGRTQRPIESQSDWEGMVKGHSRSLFPDEAWNRAWLVNGQFFIPLILTSDQPLNQLVQGIP